jgi:hypothetical protein
MSIEVDWQIVEEDAERPELAEQPVPPVKRRRRLPHTGSVVLVMLLVVGVAGFAVYYQWTLRTRLHQVTEPVRAVARLEAQAVAANDRVSFLALQDPDDAAWRAAQGEHFGRLERVGLPEVGWQAIGAQPSPGNISLQPGGVQLDVTYRFSVTLPLPGGPVSVTLQVPQFYKNTASGWVRARPGADYWGAWRTLAGRRFAMGYTQRDAALLEPIIPRMDKLLDEACSRLPCPPQPIFAIFDDSPDAISHLSDLPTFNGNSGFILELVSPHLFGLPVDAASRDELYRAIETRVIQTLVYEASGQQLNGKDWSSQEIMRWELSRAGLAGPLTLTKALLADTWQPLSVISLRFKPAGPDTDLDAVMLPLALAFVEQRVGSGAVSRMLPALGTSATFGEAITTLGIKPQELESDWQRYLRQQAGLPAIEPPAPSGELALWCARGESDRPASTIWYVHADGTGLTDLTAVRQQAWPPQWSPDGKRLAYAQGGAESASVVVMDADTRRQRTVAGATRLRGAPLVGWLPDGRLQISDGDEAHLVDLDTGTHVVITGTRQIWSPDGTRLVNLTTPYPIPTIWVADANGRDARQVASGYEPVWSPDGGRLAFFGGFPTDPFDLEGGQFHAREIQIIDLGSDSVTTLVRGEDLIRWLTNDEDQVGLMSNLAWSPDGSLLTVAISWSNGSGILVVSAETGVVRAHWQWPWTRAWFPNWSWSSDSRHLAMWVAPDSSPQGMAGILDVQTGGFVTLPGRGFGWSPDGKWLALTQEPSGLLLVAPGLAGVRWLDTPSCFNVAWRPKR